MPEDEKPSKTVVVETSTTTKRQEGESASLAFTGSKHMTKWLITAVGLLIANLGHNVIEDFLPAKGEAGREQVRQTNERAVFRNDNDNTAIKEKLDAILTMRSDLDSIKSDVKDLKTDIKSVNQRVDEVIINLKK